MMYQRIKLLALLTMMSLFLQSCLFSGGSSDKVHIRIHNKSSRDIGSVRWGSGEQNGATESKRGRGADPGEFSRYEAFEPVLANYDFAEIRFQSGEDRALAKWLYPQTYLGIPELEAGHYYTFEFDFIGDTVVFNMLEDPAP